MNQGQERSRRRQTYRLPTLMAWLSVTTFMVRGGWLPDHSDLSLYLAMIPFAGLLIMVLAIASMMMAQASRKRRCLVLIPLGVWFSAFWALLTAPLLRLWTDPFDPLALWVSVSLGLMIGMQAALRDEPPPRKPESESSKFIQEILARGMPPDRASHFAKRTRK
jgi:hypothetical protein